MNASKKYKHRLLADLVDMDSPRAVMDEVLFILTLIEPQLNPTPLTNAFNLTFGLYRGTWPGEQACNTEFHDLRHITDTVMCMARLIHGAVIHGRRLTQRQIFTGLVGCLVHDAGYIQDRRDRLGTGAKYTRVHVKRSMDFLERYGGRYGLTLEEIPVCREMIQCTDLDVDIQTLQFSSKAVAFMAKLLGVADLIGQMADRIYLEKLFYLFGEFKEAGVNGCRDAMDLLEQSFSFFDTVAERLATQLDGLDHLVTAHFNVRWNISSNLYQETIDKQKRYLEHILAHGRQDPSRLLRRKSIVSKLMKRSI